MSGAVGRRPGPRIDLDVPLKLVSVAERMFAEQSIGGVSLRAVAREAGVAPAAVTYHFATKGALVAAVIRGRDHAVGAEVRQRLQELIDREGAVTARDLVLALQVPLVRLIESDPVGGLAWMKIFSRLALTDDEVFHAAVEAGVNLNVLFARAGQRALGDRYPEAAARVGLAVYSMLTALAGADLVGYGTPLRADGTLDPEFLEQLTLFTTAGITLGS